MAGVLPGSRGLDVPRGARGAARSRPRGGRAPAGELHVGVPRLPATLDPADARDPSQLLAMRLLYQGLVAFGDRGDIEPALATAWTVSRDGLVWAFRLRQDAQLHDGTPLGPDEVVATLAERISADEPPDGAPAWVRPFRGAARIVEVHRGEGPRSRSSSPSRTRRSSRSWPPRPRDRCPPGRPASGRSGPYRAVELTRWTGSRWTAATCGEATRPSARLILHAVADDAAALAGLAPGGPLHAAQLAAPPSWAAVGLQVVSGPTWRIGLLALRANRGLTSRKTVRQAVALALDPALLPSRPRPVGGAACRLAPARRVGGARRRAHCLRPRPRAPLAGPGRADDPSMTLLASDQVSGPEAAGISRRDPGVAGRPRIPGPRAARAAGRGRGRRASGTAELTLTKRRSRERPRPVPPAAPGHGWSHARHRDQRRLLPESARRRDALARGSARVPAGATAHLPAPPGAARGRAAVRPPVRPAPVDGGARPECAGDPAGPGRACHRLERMGLEPPAAPPPPRAPLNPPLGAAAHEPSRAAAR